jgi:antitoxin FitA
MLQVRNVPDTLHRKLTARAADAGMSLSDYVKSELEKLAAQLTPSELQARLAMLEPARVAESPPDALRKERERR